MSKFFAKAANREGFTLVELIVVIAILAILAGIAIPVYSGYITKANEAADYTQLDNLKTAATFATIDSVHDAVISQIDVAASDKTVTGITVTYAASSVSTTTYAFSDTDKTTYLNGSFPTFKSDTFASGATWTEDGWQPAEAPAEGGEGGEG